MDLLIGTDSVYLDVTPGDRDRVRTVEPGAGVLLHLDASASVIAVEVTGLPRQGKVDSDDPDIVHVHVNPETDSLYLDVSAGSRAPDRMRAVADGVYLYVDEVGALTGIEVMDIRLRGALHVDALDPEPSNFRPALFNQIERVAAVGAGRRR